MQLNNIVFHNTLQANGFVMRTRENSDRSDVCQVTPHTQLPSKFPRKIFEQAIEVQQVIIAQVFYSNTKYSHMQDMNELYFRISWDYDFIRESHRQVVLTDEFTRKLMDIYTHIYKENIAQTKTLLIQRADYMCHCVENSYSLKQVS